MAQTKPIKQEEQPKYKKKLGYRTPSRFKRLISRRNPTLSVRPRSLGGHR